MHVLTHRARRPIVRGPHAAFARPASTSVDVSGASRVSVSGVSAGQVGMAALGALGLGFGAFLVTASPAWMLGGLVAGAAIGASLHSETASA